MSGDEVDDDDDDEDDGDDDDVDDDSDDDDDDDDSNNDEAEDDEQERDTDEDSDDDDKDDVNGQRGNFEEPQLHGTAAELWQGSSELGLAALSAEEQLQSLQSGMYMYSVHKVESPTVR